MPLDYTRPLAVDLFAGAGGLSLGLEQAGYEIAAAVEYDPIHAAVHEYNFPYGKTFARDVTGITGAEIRSKSEIGDREIALVAGGPPCQGISLIGRRAIDDPRNALLKEYVRLVLELQPRHFLMENVAGLTVGKHRQLLTEVIDLLSDGGYKVVTPYRVLQAADYGTPQSRKRLILLGARKDVQLPHYPEPLFTPRPIRNKPLPSDPVLPFGPSVNDALSDIPDTHSIDELLDGDTASDVVHGTPSDYAAELRGITTAADDFSHPRRFDHSVLTSSNRTNHTSTSIERFDATTPGDVEPVSRFLRLNPEGICNTLRAGTASDRGAFTAPRPIHPTYPRVITVREAARLHGYPDWFRFHVTKWNGFREIGNSVPARLGRAIGSALLKADNVTPTRGATIELGDPALLSMNASEAEKYYGIEERVIPQRDRK